MKKYLLSNSRSNEDIARLFTELNPSHVKALIALNELFTIFIIIKQKQQ